LDLVFIDLNVDILGAPPVCRGGKKMNKVRRKIMCAKATKVTTLVCVDILDVCKDKFSCQGLAQKFAIDDNKIIRVLFKKGITTIVNRKLD
jgi:hypothetical protein